MMRNLFNILTLFVFSFAVAKAVSYPDPSMQPPSVNIYEEALRKTGIEIPRFEDFPAGKIYQGKNSKVNFKSNDDAYEYRTVIRDAVKLGATFAGHYAVAAYGWGPQRQGNFIIDLKTGQIVDFFVSYPNRQFRPDSRLMIVNPIEHEDIDTIKDLEEDSQPGTYRQHYEVEYYVLENNKLKHLKTIDLYPHKTKLLEIYTKATNR